jgi:hypothetical protein
MNEFNHLSLALPFSSFFTGNFIHAYRVQSGRVRQNFFPFPDMSSIVVQLSAHPGSGKSPKSRLVREIRSQRNILQLRESIIAIVA